MEINNRLSDEELDQVSGGVSRYSVYDLKKAGVNVSTSGGKTTYSTILSSGKKIDISESVASSIADCYKLSGGARLTDQQINDLIAQS